MKSNLLRNVLVVGIVVGLLAVTIAVYAQNVSRARHPNLAAAQSLIERAINKISAAQVANEFDMEGHAAKAKALLDQAFTEIKLAAEAANVHR